MIEQLLVFFESLIPVMRWGIQRNGSPLRVCWWAAGLWWWLMSGEHPKPLGEELAGCGLRPDGVSSGPFCPPLLVYKSASLTMKTPATYRHLSHNKWGRGVEISKERRFWCDISKLSDGRPRKGYILDVWSRTAQRGSARCGSERKISVI